MSRSIAFLPRFAGIALAVALVLAPTVLPSGGDKAEARTKAQCNRDCCCRNHCSSGRARRSRSPWSGIIAPRRHGALGKRKRTLPPSFGTIGPPRRGSPRRRSLGGRTTRTSTKVINYAMPDDAHSGTAAPSIGLMIGHASDPAMRLAALIVDILAVCADAWVAAGHTKSFPSCQTRNSTGAAFLARRSTGASPFIVPAQPVLSRPPAQRRRDAQ